MALPDFLGIGAPRCGSTWLHDLLASHPKIYVPTDRKEVRFFDVYYDRGLQWYERFFPADEQVGQFQAIGEITPGYLYCQSCPGRIADIGSVDKLLLILRNPVDRAYSRYGIDVRYRDFQGSFEEFCAHKPYGIEEGFYSRGLESYLAHFAREQFLVLIYERAVADVSQTKAVLADFFQVPASLFPPDAGARKIHARYVPSRARYVYTLGIALSRKLRDLDQDWANRAARRLRIRRFFGQSAALPPMKAETRSYLNDLYATEIGKLESLLHVDLACWR